MDNKKTFELPILLPKDFKQESLQKISEDINSYIWMLNIQMYEQEMYNFFKENKEVTGVTFSVDEDDGLLAVFCEITDDAIEKNASIEYDMNTLAREKFESFFFRSKEYSEKILDKEITPTTCSQIFKESLPEDLGSLLEALKLNEKASKVKIKNKSVKI